VSSFRSVNVDGFLQQIKSTHSSRWICFIDNGSAIPDKVRQHLVDPFSLPSRSAKAWGYRLVTKL
jgi:nitrogen-specific signal transduction histidine kinase